MIDERWPVHPKPIIGESLTCWLQRIASFYGLGIQDLLACNLGFSGLTLDDIDEQPPAELVKAIAGRTGITSEQIWLMTGARRLRQQNVAPKMTTGARPTPPAKKRNADKRSREYLTKQEVKTMIEAANNLGMYGERDAALILMSYRHALRVGEVANLKWEQVDLRRGLLHVSRLHHGDPSDHYLESDEIRCLRKFRRWHPNSNYVFNSQRQGALSTRQIRTIIERAGRAAGIAFPVHPAMLRHGKGFELAEKGIGIRSIQAYMGHKNIKHTANYTDFDPSDLKGFGNDVKLN
jgi:type 1 fimbriae regulatory protein FimE